MLAPREETPSKQEEDGWALKEHMKVQERQDKLLEKLNLDGLSEWTPHNAVSARELMLSYHDVFALEPDELGCTSTIEHEIHLSNKEPFKEQFRHLYWTKFVHPWEICWRLALFDPVSLPGVTPLCWYGRRMGLFDSALTSDDSTHRQRICVLSPGYKKH